MAMDPAKMADAVILEYKEVTDAVEWKDGKRPPPLAYVEAFDRGLTEYVEKNMEITYSWSAALPPPASTPDPVTSFISELVIEDKTIGQPPTLAAWGPLIMACFAKAETKHPGAFSVAAGKLLIKPLVITPSQEPFPGPIKTICKQIYTWLLSCINPAPLDGTHASYKGATTGMVNA
jgi:hypothetical protein